MNTAIKTEDALGSRYRTGMLVSLASIVMLFTSLSSAYVVRSGVMIDWFPIALPRVMFGSTALILLSSVSIEIARRKLKQNVTGSYSRYLLLTTALGIGFLVSQLIAWRQLTKQGIYLASNPYSSFFYLLTGAHAVHLAGGLFALCFLWFRSRNQVVRQATADAVSIYWHFMDALWIYLFLLLLLWR
ncbi:MAG TPA: cytochrome c oxidase subunit 3 [Pyrinomonadaceae bacterium]|nr:cytochrome c oxidase subunit 3 [Pyrinomonadaceae bacterium]